MISYPGGVTITPDDGGAIYIPPPPDIPAQLCRIEALLARVADALGPIAAEMSAQEKRREAKKQLEVASYRALHPELSQWMDKEGS